MGYIIIKGLSFGIHVFEVFDICNLAGCKMPPWHRHIYPAQCYVSHILYNVSFHKVFKFAWWKHCKLTRATYNVYELTNSRRAICFHFFKTKCIENEIILILLIPSFSSLFFFFLHNHKQTFFLFMQLIVLTIVIQQTAIT